MRTEYETHQAAFSKAAHLAARRDVYPSLFGTADIDYENFDVEQEGTGRLYDGRMGIDLIARPKRDLGHLLDHRRNALSSRLHFYVQERFRRPSYSGYQDVTITEFNHASGTPSELYKIAAGLMVYGIYDEAADAFLSAHVVDVARTLLAIQRGRLSFSKNRNRKGQDFVCVRLCDLREAGCILWRLRVRNGA